MIDAASATGCPWPYSPRGFDPCASPPSGLTPLVLDIPGEYLYDTGDTTLLTPDGTTLSLTATKAGAARIVWTSGFLIEVDSTLRVIGTDPLVLVSMSDLTVEGTVDISSKFTGSSYQRGAGSNPGVCPTSAPTTGPSCQHGGGGGGGGGFGSSGNEGGRGGGTRDCGAGMTGIAGGLGGNALGTVNSLRGGCGGQAGGVGDGEDSDPGVGGPGGGAMYLLTRNTLTVATNGVVHAGGAGGRPAFDDRAGGGGGGTGGMLQLAGSMVTVRGVIAANGGGGGGGVEASIGTAGEDAKPETTAAAGGPAQGVGGRGGDGATGELPATPGTDGNRGGGGGGGGAGIIRIQALSSTLEGTITPPPS